MKPPRITKTAALVENFFDATSKRDCLMRYQTGRDCPLCMIEFVKKDIVVQLRCGFDHIYHRECLKKMLLLPCV